MKRAKVVKCPHCGEEMPFTFEISFHTDKTFSLPSDSK